MLRISYFSKAIIYVGVVLMQKDEQREQRYESSRYEPLHDSYNTVVFRLEPAMIINELRGLLRGERYNKRTERFEKVPGLSPLMSNEGIELLMMQLRGHLSTHTVLGNLTGKEINDITRSAGNTVRQFLFCKGRAYGVKSDEDWAQIFWLVVDNIKIFLSRAKDGKENEMLSKQFEYREQTSVVERAPKQDDQGGFMPVFSKGGFFKR